MRTFVITIFLMDCRDVVFECADLTESFFAMRTFVITSSLMTGRDVSFQSANYSKSFLAIRTFWSLNYTFHMCFKPLKSFSPFFTITQAVQSFISLDFSQNMFIIVVQARTNGCLMGLEEDMEVIHGPFSSLFYPIRFMCLLIFLSCLFMRCFFHFFLYKINQKFNQKLI